MGCELVIACATVFLLLSHYSGLLFSLPVLRPMSKLMDTFLSQGSMRFWKSFKTVEVEERSLLKHVAEKQLGTLDCLLAMSLFLARLLIIRHILNATVWGILIVMWIRSSSTGPMLHYQARVMAFIRLYAWKGKRHQQIQASPSIRYKIDKGGQTDTT